MPVTEAGSGRASDGEVVDGPDRGDTVGLEDATRLGAVLRAVWSTLDIGVMIFDGEARPIATNPAAERMLGRVFDGAPPASRVIYFGDGVTVCPPSSYPVWRALRGEVVRDEELVIQTAVAPEGRRLMVSALPVLLDDGAPGALSSISDVTDRWSVEEKNRTTLDQLSQLLAGAADYAIFLLDPTGHVVTWSISAQRLKGYTEQEILGRSFATFFTAEDRDRGEPERLLAAAGRDGRVETNGPRLRKDGSTFWARGVITAIRDEDGKVTAFTKVCQDVTRERAAEQAVLRLNGELRQLNTELEERVRERTAALERQKAELEAANAELEAFSYSVSHDLRAPLRAVHGFARIVSDRYADALPDEAREYLDRVQSGALQMGNLIDALLQLSRMQRQPLRAERIDVAQQIRHCWDLLAEARKGRTVELVMDDDLPDAEGDVRLVEQVWVNLLDNAIKYTQATPYARVEVGGVVDGDAVTYFVRDNGAGFDMRYGAKLFKVFQRLHSAEEYPGIGIGLAVVQRIVHRHGGKVWADAELGRGATFFFSLRRAAWS